MITRYNIFNQSEEKIFNFNDFEQLKYNGNILLNQIMEWLRAKRLDDDSDEIRVPIEKFFKECSVDKNKFMTFYNEMDKTKKVKNFNIIIDGTDIIFNNFKNSGGDTNEEISIKKRP
jgi:hypothetical protein